MAARYIVLIETPTGEVVGPTELGTWEEAMRLCVQALRLYAPEAVYVNRLASNVALVGLEKYGLARCTIYRCGVARTGGEPGNIGVRRPVAPAPQGANGAL